MTLDCGCDVDDDRGMTAPTKLAWLVSWDNRMHAFTKAQPVAEFAVTAICGHISRPRSIHRGDAMQCGGCLVKMGMTMSADDAWR